MAATDALLLNKINTASATAMSNELITGFSTPPSSSLDTCDSGFTELYSNNFTLINSTKQIIDKPDMKGISSSASETNFPDTDLENSVPTTIGSTENTSDGSLKKDSLIGPEEPNDRVDEDGYADDESDDFDDGDDASSDMSDLSDELNDDIAPEMQRTINWVCASIP